VNTEQPARRPSALRAVLVIVALQALAVITYWQVEQHRARSVRPFPFERLREAPVLPPVALERSDGQRVPAESLHSRPVLLHFWATWCPPCREELPALLALGRDDPELDVVALSLDDDWGTVRDFFGGAIPAEVVREPGGVLRQTYAVGTLPDTYLLDSEGKATLRFMGARPWASPEARAALQPHVVRYSSPR
jgi:thiol-disulfide isomerase/thioredoxin